MDKKGNDLCTCAFTERITHKNTHSHWDMSVLLLLDCMNVISHHSICYDCNIKTANMLIDSIHFAHLLCHNKSVTRNKEHIRQEQYENE